MIKAATTITLGFVFLFTALKASQAQTTPTQEAVNEAVYRQANRILLRQKLEEAKAAQERHDLPMAAKLYDDCWELIQKIGTGVDAEVQATKSGLTTVRMELAKDAQRHDDLKEAGVQVDDILRVDPSNAKALDFKRENDKMLAAQRGQIPSEEAKQQVPALAEQKVKASTLMQDGKMFFEMGKLDLAQERLQQAIGSPLPRDHEQTRYHFQTRPGGG
jgi:hypothetical protein